MHPINSYQTIKTLVQTDELELIHVVGLPRSNGTALHIALTQGEKVAGQINEPLCYPDLRGRKYSYLPEGKPQRTFEEGCAHIVEKYYREKATHPQQKITLVIHDLSRDITEKEHRKLLKISAHMVFCLREPSQVALSMFTRYVNDKLSQPGGKKLKAAEVVDLMHDDQDFAGYVRKHPESLSQALICKLLGKAESEPISDQELLVAKEKVIDIFLEEYEIAWDNLYRLFTITQMEAKKEEWSIFDSAWLFDKPEVHLKQLCERIKSIAYTPAMIFRWTKGVKENFHCIITRNWGHFAQINAWNGPVRNSSGIEKQPDSLNREVSLLEFPSRLRPAIRQRRLPYQQMLASL